MKTAIAFWNIMLKDFRNYYLKPPNISWGIIFPFSWMLMFFLKSQTPVDVRAILPGIMAMSILFGTTSLLSVTITFERRSRSFDRLLLAPISLTWLMLAKTLGAILFGIVNAFVPVLIAMFFIPVSNINWAILVLSVIFVAFFVILILIVIYYHRKRIQSDYLAPEERNTLGAMETEILKLIRQTGKSMRQSEICDLIPLEPVEIANFLSSLQDKKLIKREWLSDERVYLVRAV
jgi:hypothetical protein